MPTESTAEEIVARIVCDMTRVLKRRNKTFARGALDDWRASLLKAVTENLENGGKWSTSRAKVLSVAKDMARIARLLAGSKSSVDRDQVQASFQAVKEHNECRGTMIKGRWCDF